MQWLDEVDDLISTLRSLRERLRRLCIALTVLAISLLVQVAGVILALRHPPLAMAVAMIMLVTLLYHLVTSPRVVFQRTA